MKNTVTTIETNTNVIETMVQIYWIFLQPEWKARQDLLLAQSVNKIYPKHWWQIKNNQKIIGFFLAYEVATHRVLYNILKKCENYLTLKFVDASTIIEKWNGLNESDYWNVM